MKRAIVIEKEELVWHRVDDGAPLPAPIGESASRALVQNMQIGLLERAVTFGEGGEDSDIIIENNVTILMVVSMKIQGACM